MELCLPWTGNICRLILHSFQSVARMAKSRRLVHLLVFAVLLSKSAFTFNFYCRSALLLFVLLSGSSSFMLESTSGSSLITL